MLIREVLDSMLEVIVRKMYTICFIINLKELISLKLPHHPFTPLLICNGSVSYMPKYHSLSKPYKMVFLIFP